MIIFAYIVGKSIIIWDFFLVSFIINTFSTIAWDAAYPSHETLCWSVTNDLFVVFKTTAPAPNQANICGILAMNSSQLSMNLYQAGAFRMKKIQSPFSV